MVYLDNIKISENIFCEKELNSYEKTILTLVIAYSQEPTFVLETEDITGLSELLNIDLDLMKKALSFKCCSFGKVVILQFGRDKTDCSKFFKRTFFDAIIKLYFAYKNLNTINDSTDKDSTLSNIEKFRTVLYLFDTINAFIATYECMENDNFSYDYTVFDSPDFSPQSLIQMLFMLITSDDCLTYNKSLIQMISMILKYEFRCRINTLYVVMICQILKHSPFFDDETLGIAKEMYDKLLCILKNGRVISIRINAQFIDENKSFTLRGRNDNTTRLEMIYGFSNYDIYELRFDLSHKGQPYTHFNNISPGGIQCCLLNKKEYQQFIAEYPDLADCFVGYGNTWAFMEHKNQKLPSTAYKDALNFIQQKYKHTHVFKNRYSEKSQIEFINLLSNMLPNYCNVYFKTDDNHMRDCFTLDIIMRDIFLMYLSCLSQNTEYQKLFVNQILNRAISCGIISENERCTMSSIEGILLISEEIQNRTMI